MIRARVGRELSLLHFKDLIQSFALIQINFALTLPLRWGLRFFGNIVVVKWGVGKEISDELLVHSFWLSFVHIEFIIFGQLIHLFVKMRFVNLNRVSMLQFYAAAVRVKLIELI